MNTRERILSKAVEMFNDRGIEYVGLRELAGLLDMRVSNITYYFPTKDDLVYEIAMLLNKKNSDVMVKNDSITMHGFLKMMQQVFIHHIEFRCLLLSFVHVLEQNKLIAASYKNTQNTRNATTRSNIDALGQQGYLKVKDDDEKQFLVSSIALISRFWISEATISFKQLGSKAQMKHYLNLLARLMLPYATARGKKDIRVFMHELLA